LAEFVEFYRPLEEVDGLVLEEELPEFFIPGVSVAASLGESREELFVGRLVGVVLLAGVTRVEKLEPLVVGVAVAPGAAVVGVALLGVPVGRGAARMGFTKGTGAARIGLTEGAGATKMGLTEGVGGVMIGMTLAGIV
jgi:hypothetical protein